MTPLTISAAMIVRDEAFFLPGCLETLRGRVDEIVVVDTGSVDASPRLALDGGARVFRHLWTGDFAAARNRALDEVSGEWVLSIDADERLTIPTGASLHELVDREAIAAFVQFRPKTGFTRYREARLFRRDPRLRFSGRIHETMVPAIEAISAQTKRAIPQTAAQIDHLGYDGDQAHKHARNLDLLQAAVEEWPERVYYWYHLAETLIALGRTKEALEAAANGIAAAKKAQTDKQRADASMIFQMLARVSIERKEDAFAIIEDGLAAVPDDHALCFLKGRAMLDSGKFELALEIAERLRAINPDRLVDGLMSFDRRIFREFAWEMTAIALLRTGRPGKAAAAFRRAAELAPHDPSYRLKAAALGGRAS